MVFAGTPVACASWPTVNARSITVPPLYDVSEKKGTRSTRWKVKGKQAKKIAEIMNMYETLYTQRCYSTSGALLSRLYIKELVEYLTDFACLSHAGEMRRSMRTFYHALVQG
jgi:hypothetical protein